MARIKLEKVTGAVALAYLLLIPAGAYVAWRKLQIIDQDVTEVWNKLNMPPAEHAPIVDLRGLFKGLRAK